jgi:hypothetical protein
MPAPSISSPTGVISRRVHGHMGISYWTVTSPLYGATVTVSLLVPAFT